MYVRLLLGCMRYPDTAGRDTWPILGGREREENNDVIQIDLEENVSVSFELELPVQSSQLSFSL